MYYCYFSFFILLALSPEVYYAQGEDNIWYFGQNAGLDFNAGTPPTALFNSQMNTSEGCSSISDATGNLLLYTNGVTVWDRSHSPMLNGTGLMGDISSTQSALIGPYIGDQNKYHVFTTDGATSFPTIGPTNPKGQWDGLKYNVVNMTLNGGLGGVVPGFKNRNMVDSTREQIAAARHANGIDYWIITRKEHSRKYYAFLVTCSGIDTANPVISDSGTLQNPPGWAYNGHLKASYQSDALVSTFMGYYTELHDFDNATGRVSNARLLTNILHGGGYGASFSPDGNVIYVTHSNRIHRYLRHAPNIPATETVATFPGFSFGALQLGPDGKIYVAHSAIGITSVGVIHNPNNFTTPNIQTNFAPLGGRPCMAGLPNYFTFSQFAPPLKLAGKDTSVCSSGDSVKIGVAPFAGLNYFWTPTAGLSSTTVSNPTASPTATTHYILAAYTSCDTIFDTVMVNAGASIGSKTLTPACDSLLFNESWYYNSQSVNDTAFNASYIGCDSITVTQIIINKPPVISIGNDTSIEAGTSITLNAGEGFSYQWSTGSSTQAITVQPDSTDMYIVTVTDVNGCAASDTITIKVTRCDAPVFVPNGFSPNGDGQNDVLKLFSDAELPAKGFFFVIYNRWGGKVFETNSINDWWDGSFKNRPVDSGVYFYVLKSFCTYTSEEIIRKGNISLIR